MLTLHTTGRTVTLAGTIDLGEQNMSKVLNMEMDHGGQEENINFCCEIEKSMTGTL
jgi:hypothetical protein